MVRKINKQKVKVKKNKIVLKSTEDIDRKIKLFMDTMKDVLTEEQHIKFEALTKDNSSIYFMEKAFNIIINFNNNIDKIDVEGFIDNFKVDCELLILEYEKKYNPKPITMFFCSLFALNKSISKYFRINEFKKRFTKESEDSLYLQSVYKFFNHNIPTNPIQISKDRVFTGVWEEKIKNISIKIDDMLCRLNQFRETYVIGDVLQREFNRSRQSLTYELKEERDATKVEIKKLERIFGNDEIGKQLLTEHLKKTHIKYKPEFNLLIDVVLFTTLISAPKNLSVLARDLQLMTNNFAYANNFASEMKALAIELAVFFNNFTNLVDNGIDTYDEKMQGYFGDFKLDN